MKKTISFVTLGLQFNGNSVVEKSLNSREFQMFLDIFSNIKVTR
jgi:hypothetical protein